MTMASANARVYPEPADDRQLAAKIRVSDDHSMDVEDEWTILHGRFPWNSYRSQTIEQKYMIFRKEKMLRISKHSPISSIVMGGVAFSLSIFHFKEEKVPAILSTCIFLLMSVAVLSLYGAKEIQTSVSHIVAQFVNIVPFFLLACWQLLDMQDIAVSNTRQEWVAYFVFLAFITLPMRYWACCALIFILFLGHISMIAFKLIRRGVSSIDVVYQISVSTTMFFCTCAFGSYMYHRMDSYLRNAFFAMKNSFLTNIAIERTQILQKNLLSVVLPKDVVTTIARDFSVYSSNSFRELCNKYHEDVSMVLCTVVGLGDLADRSPQSCVVLINDLMSQFTYLAKKHFMEEIGWTLSEYSAVCGARETRTDHPILTVYMAMSMLEYMRELKVKVKLSSVHLRVAVHTGDVVTAVLGSKHCRYELLGKDVTEAKALLLRANNGQVLISSNTRSTLHDEFIIEAITESIFSVKFVIKRFSAIDHEMGIAARRIHRKKLEEDVQKLRDMSKKYRELKRKRSSLQAVYQNSIKPVCDRKRENLSVPFIVLCVMFTLTMFYVTSVISHGSMDELIVLIVALVFQLGFLPLTFIISKIKNHKSILTLIFGHLFLIGLVTYFCVSTVILLADCKTKFTSSNDTVLAGTPQHNVCSYPSFITTAAVILLVAFSSCSVVGLATKLCLITVLAALQYVVNFSAFPGFSGWFFDYSRSPLPNYDITAHFSGICLSAILLNIQISRLGSGLVALTVRNQRKNQQLLGCKRRYRMLVLDAFPYEMATSFLRHIDNQRSLFEGTVNTLGVAILSISDREEYENPDNETVDTDHRAIQFVEKIDKVLQEIPYCKVYRMASSVTSHIFISGVIYGVQENQETDENNHLNQLIKFLQQVKIICSEMNIDNTKAGVHFGSTLSSMVGGSRARWGVWGATVDVANGIHKATSANTIKVSKKAAEILETFGHKFDDPENLKIMDSWIAVRNYKESNLT